MSAKKVETEATEEVIEEIIEEKTEEAEEKSSVFIIKEDCKVTYKGHFLEYKKNDQVDEYIGKYLLETGAPIKEVK